MRPDQRWFPTDRIDRAAWFANFSAIFTELGPSLGFSQAEIDSVAADNAVIQYSVQAIVSLEAQMAAARAFDRSVTLGRQSGSVPQFPLAVLPTPPTMVSDGIFERLEKIVRRIRVSPFYDSVAGAQLGIIPVARRIANPYLFMPTPKIEASADPYSFTVQVAKRSFAGFRVYYKRDAATDWENSMFFTSSPAKVAVPPLEPGKAELINVRVAMAIDNTATSLPSNIHTLAIIP
ncbi:MAG TPA: hypothetical protein PKD26_11845 [Pyrinomonadaceae bacterium]|nr:hypothetical protein [Pyrinomonadaceae bacterium]